MVNNRMESNHGFYDSGCSSPVPETRDKNGFEVLPNEENWVHIQDAELILQTLKQSFVVEELKDGLLRLQNLQIFTHIEVQKYLENNQVHLLVLSVMKHLSAFDDIQLIGLQLLCSFISHSCILEDSIKNSDTYSHVMEVLQNNISDSEIHKGGMKIFSCLLEDDYIKMKLKSEGRLNEVLDMVFKSIAVFKDDDGIQFYAFTSLAHLLRFDDETKKEMMKKFYQLMMDSLSINSCKPDIVEKILIIMNILAHNETVCNDEVQSGFMMDILFPTLIGQPEEAEIQMLGLEIFQFTASGFFKDLDTADSASNWIRVIYTSMSQHLDSPLVQKSSCMALSKLLCCKPEAYMWIGESTELKQYPLHSLCLGTLLMYSKFEELYVAACDCFFYLAADNDALCKNLMEKNSHVAIIEGMKLHLSYPAAQASSCRALRGLCIFHDENKLIVSEYDDILQILVTILRRYGQNIGVLSEVMSTITCLADIDVIRHQCIVEKVHLHILSILDNFPDDRIIQEAGIEAIAVLGGAASGAEVLNYYRAVEKIIRGLLNFQYYINIQKKGLIAIQILADNDVLKSPDMCTELAQVIRMIMLTHKSVSSIQREAVVLMQILAEKGRPMSEVLVKQGCHEILFQILERYDDDRGLHDLASECLYVIGCEQNLKSSMLLAACAKGFLAGVECLLEIGSDVNIGEGQETPLYFAVKNQDENMVRLLLKHEVTDVRTPLRHSLDKQYHYITSLLLPYVDQDHDLKKAGTVIWNDFGLGNLRPEWFLSTFGGQKETRPSPGAGKNLFAKIKKSEQKRTKRLSHSPSDSYLEIMRHQCWRVRRNNCDFIKHKAEIIRNIREAEDLKSNTKRPKSFPKRFYRQGGDETKKSSSPTSDSPPKDKIEPALIIPIPDDPLFEHSEDEWEDWKKTTLTGANIPFSPSDPRRQKERTKRKGMGAPPVKWQRKYTQIEDPTYTGQTSRQTLDQTSRQSLEPNSRRGSWDLSSESSGLFSIDFNEDRTRFNAYDTCTEMETSIDDNLEPDYMITPEFTMKCLDVSSNKISTFSQLVEQGEEFLKHFNQLQRLIASNNTISQFPMKFSQVSKLKHSEQKKDLEARTI
ncbi:hypothetical protein SNE40_015465 [Patella caerulea]|uniref:Uncharacterized protein n=1 Tax=Patella caerulea TaxID=87958 RepID=A0AAN8JFR5_PATCE